ncbi:MAG: MMPL family transporter [Deltaproteobacteria bacterium]|nr:MMPL family transporter [Deltaproteobacteria bacterium]
MSGIRNRIETWFENLAVIIFDNRYKTLFVMLAIVSAFASQLPKITLDTTMEGFLHKDDPSLVDYEAFKDQFGRDQMLVIALSPPDVFDMDFLAGLKKLHDELIEKVPHLEDITSLINARNTYGENDVLIVDDLLENWPQTPEDLEAIKDRALNNPIYMNLLISEDLKFTTIMIETSAFSSTEVDALEGFDNFSEVEPGDTAPADTDSDPRQYLTDQENSEVINAVEAILKSHRIADTQIYVSGIPAVVHSMKIMMAKDMGTFMCIAVATIVLFLLTIFRRISGVLFPLLIVLLSIVSTIGLMAATGTALKVQTQILPSFLLAVGVSASVHILAIFFRHFNMHHNRKNAIVYAMGHSGFAVVMTSVTTAAGLLSFSTAAVARIGDLGKFAAAGVMMALIYTIILLPALLAVISIKPFGNKKGTNDQALSKTDALLTSVGNISIRHPYRILIISAAILVFATYGISKVRFYHEYMEGLKSGEIFIGKAWSITAILKEINRALHNNDDEFYTIPQDKRLIAQEFLLFENSGSDDLEDVTDSRFSKARLTMKVPFIDFVVFADFLDRISSYFKEKFPEAAIKVTGMAAIFVKVEYNAIISLAKSYVYAMIIITILMILLIGGVRIGLLSMVPNITPILITIGGMGWFNVPMDLFNMLVGSIAIELAVDDTIHFMHNFRRYFEESGNAEKAVIETLLTTGRAITVTTCVLSLGFFTFMVANMNNLICFGALTGITIILALLSDFFLAPALMIAVNRKKKKSS